MKKDNIKDTADRHGIFAVYIFGSQAEKGRRYFNGENVIPDTFTDLDIAVAFERPPVEAIKIYGILYKEISEIFEPFNVDLLFMHDVNAILRYEVIKGVRIYERDENRADEFEEDIMKMAGDLLFKKRGFNKDVMEAIESGYFEFEYSPNP